MGLTRGDGLHMSGAEGRVGSTDHRYVSGSAQPALCVGDRYRQSEHMGTMVDRRSRWMPQEGQERQLQPLLLRTE